MKPQTPYIIYVNNGYSYEYECTIQATSVVDARKKWKERGDWKTIDFWVSRNS